MECNGKKLGSILWNGCENMLVCWSADGITVREYKDVLLALLDRTRPGLFVEAVGPDPVLYRSKVAKVLRQRAVESLNMRIDATMVVLFA